MSMLTHSDYMQQALDLAIQGQFTTSPNPMVGCVIVKNGSVIGQGFHRYAGGPHAEVIALAQAGEAAKGATAYVSLEPCCHTGRTPPCTDALINAKIHTVYAATLDPNPLVAGKGIKALQTAGIHTHVGLLAEKAQQLNILFFHYIRYRRPFVIAKWAMSLDGKTITHPNDSRHISSANSQTFSHQTRMLVDAILVGANTVRKDNPRLTVRTQENLQKNPLRIVLTESGDLPLENQFFSDEAPTLVVTSDRNHSDWINKFKQHNIEVLILPSNSQGQVSLPALLDALGERHIMSLLVEGGQSLHASFFAEQLVNKVEVYLAPLIIGSLEKKAPLYTMHCKPLENDFYFTAFTQEITHV